MHCNWCMGLDVDTDFCWSSLGNTYSDMLVRQQAASRAVLWCVKMWIILHALWLEAQAHHSCLCCSSGQAQHELHIFLNALLTISFIVEAHVLFFSVVVGHDMVGRSWHGPSFCSPQHQSLSADLIRVISLKGDQLVDVGVHVCVYRLLVWCLSSSRWWTSLNSSCWSKLL